MIDSVLNLIGRDGPVSFEAYGLGLPLHVIISHPGADCCTLLIGGHHVQVPNDALRTAAELGTLYQRTQGKVFVVKGCDAFGHTERALACFSQDDADALALDWVREMDTEGASLAAETWKDALRLLNLAQVAKIIYMPVAKVTEATLQSYVEEREAVSEVWIEEVPIDSPLSTPQVSGFIAAIAAIEASGFEREAIAGGGEVLTKSGKYCRMVVSSLDLGGLPSSKSWAVNVYLLADSDAEPVMSSTSRDSHDTISFSEAFATGSAWLAWDGSHDSGRAPKPSEQWGGQPPADEVRAGLIEAMGGEIAQPAKDRRTAQEKMHAMLAEHGFQVENLGHGAQGFSLYAQDDSEWAILITAEGGGLLPEPESWAVGLYGNGRLFTSDVDYFVRTPDEAPGRFWFAVEEAMRRAEELAKPTVAELATKVGERTPEQIVAVAEELAAKFAEARGYVLRGGATFHGSQAGGQAYQFWLQACEAMIFLQNTDPADALSEIE